VFLFTIGLAGVVLPNSSIDICITWYLLCISTLPLCSINRSGICNYKRICSM